MPRLSDKAVLGEVVDRATQESGPPPVDLRNPLLDAVLRRPDQRRFAMRNVPAVPELRFDRGRRHGVIENDLDLSLRHGKPTVVSFS